MTAAAKVEEEHSVVEFLWSESVVLPMQEAERIATLLKYRLHGILCCEFVM